MASRGLTAGMLAAIAAGTVRPAIFFEGEYNGGTLRLWTGVGTTSWNGQSWTGGGQLLGISPLGEATDVAAVGFTVTLSGMPSALISIALASVRQGKPGTLWLALYDSAGALIVDPYQLQKGRFDITVIEDAGDTCTIAAQYESRLIDLERARERRYTHEDQQIDYVGDLGFAFVAALQDMQILWGGPAAAASPITNGDMSGAAPGGGVSSGGGVVVGGGGGGSGIRTVLK